jgi:hypothetical protein
MLAEWAYGAIYRDSDQRIAVLSVWLDHYNYRRPHGALNHQPPANRLRQLTGTTSSGPTSRHRQQEIINTVHAHSVAGDARHGRSPFLRSRCTPIQHGFGS